jgi:hypothetical protein
MLQKILTLCIGTLSYIAPRQTGQWAAGLLQRPRKYAIRPEQLPASDNVIVLNKAAYLPTYGGGCGWLQCHISGHLLNF